MTTNSELSGLLSAANAVLFDFDGPLCEVFAGMPADGVARSLEKVMGQPVDTDDPLQVLRESVRFGPDIVRAVDDALIAAEVAAVACSRRVCCGVEAVRACLDEGKRVAVVSNNSADAVAAFLGEHVVSNEIVIVGRRYADPLRMKPDPWSLVFALETLNVANSDAVFVGDSLTDLQVSQTVGVAFLAYANKPWKLREFGDKGATIVDSMCDIFAQLV